MEQAAKALQLEASDFITKPISDDVLLVSVKRAQDRYIAKKALQIKYDPIKKEDQITFDTEVNGFNTIHESIIETSMDGALVCDENQTIVALNKKWNN